jgi:peptidoglycan hydrolase CwlO-like protein
MKELEAQKKQWEDEKRQYEELIYKFAEDRDNLDVTTNQYKSEIAELKSDLEETSKKLKVTYFVMACLLCFNLC